jgi:hypothetical protein
VVLLLLLCIWHLGVVQHALCWVMLLLIASGAAEQFTPHVAFLRLFQMHAA